MMFFIFIFCAAVNDYGLSKFISTWFITRKFVKGRPWVFTLVFLGSIFVLGGLTSATPAALIGWGILYSICDQCGYKKGDGYTNMMVFGIVFSAQVGMSLIPFKQVPLTVISAFESLSGINIEYGKYILISIVCCMVCAFLFLVIGKMVFQPDMSNLAALDSDMLNTDDALTLNKKQKIVFGFLFALVLCLLLPNFVPKTFFLSAFLGKLGNTGIVLFIVGLMCMIKMDGAPLLPLKKMIDSGVAWGIIFLLAVIQPLSSLMVSDESGITKLLMNILEPAFGGHSAVFFMVVIGMIATIVANFMNAGAVGVALMPIVYTYCMSANINPQLAVIMVVMCVHLAFLTPAASSSAAMFHGNDWIDSKTIWKHVPFVIAISWFAHTVVTLLMGSVLF